MTLCFKQGKQTKKVKYLLKDRDMAGDKRMGFSNADVLYMLMPDRFANGNPHNDAFKTMRDKTCDRTAPTCDTEATWRAFASISTTSRTSA